MKKCILLIAFTILSINFSLSQEKLNIDIEKSTIKWIGEYTFHFGGHDGFINFKEGHFIKTGDVISGGEFIINMNSITNTDIEKNSEANKNLVNHLKEPDFFDVKKHPLSILKITQFKYYKNNEIKVYADLTIKGITKPISFNGKLDYKEKELKTRFKIDRKEWNVSYKSKIKNSAISDAIGFEISVKL